jgi:hypothetical protein
MADSNLPVLPGELNAATVTELVRNYEQRIRKLEQQVFVLEKAIQDTQRLGVPYYGLECKRVLEQVEGILYEALRNSKKVQEQP